MCSKKKHIPGRCRQVRPPAHDGSLSTGHANSAQDMLFRLETMVLMGMEIPIEAVRRQIASGIDILVHLSRLEDCSRRVVEICEVLDVKDREIQLHPLYRRNRNTKDKNGICDLVKVGDIFANCKLKED